MTPDLAAALCQRTCTDPLYSQSRSFVCNHPWCILAALTAAGYAVVAVPEDVVVPLGARLVDWGICEHGGPVLYAIEEDTP